MSQRVEKGVAQPRVEKGEKREKTTFGDGTRPESIPEITHNGWKEWDDTMLRLKEYLRANFQDLQSICPDPMMLTIKPAYMVYEFPTPDFATLEALDETTDPKGFRAKLIMSDLNNDRAVVTKMIRKQMEERGSAYQLIRSMCSPALNAILMVEAKFIAIKCDDPLGLLDVIKSVVTSRCDGNQELERSQALRDWYTLRMNTGEDIVTYGRRAVKVFDRLAATGVPGEQIPNAKQQAMGLIDGLSSTVQVYHDYKNYLSNSLECTATDIYPKTLVEAINGATRFHRGTKGSALQSAIVTAHTALTAKNSGKPGGPPKGEKPLTKDKRKKIDPSKIKEPKVKFAKEAKEGKFSGNCYHCGKAGHRASECRKKAAEEAVSAPKASYSATRQTDEDDPSDKDNTYTSFGQMWDQEVNEDQYGDRNCSVCLTTSPVEVATLGPRTDFSANQNIHQRSTSEAIFDTGATGTIITCADVLSDISTCTPTVFKGLHGSLTVTKAGNLRDIGIVHFDPRAGLSIISASDCLLQGHNWEFRQGSTVDQDAFLLHTDQNTYKFQHRGGLYVADLATPPEPRYSDAAERRNGYAHPAIAKTPSVNMFYSTKLATTEANESKFTKREVQRSVDARRLQASLGFPPDQKFISALRAGTFLNCDILPEDIARATAIWGANTASLKGRTIRMRPMPPPQLPTTARTFDDQHMHCDVMFINRQPFLVSITHPLGIVLVACVENLTTPVLRQSIKRMFGTIGSRRISIVKFTSDNERGIAALVNDMNAMGVEVITVGPGQHDHIIERMIRHLKETIRCTIFSLPYLLPDVLMPHLVMSSARKLLLFPSSTRTDRISPFEAFFGRKADTKKDIGPPFGSYCQVTARVLSNNMDPRTIGCLYLEPKMNGTGTHTFMRIDNRSIISANHYVVLPIPPLVTTTINGWASKNKIHTSQEPIFTFHDRDITGHIDDDMLRMDTPSELVPTIQFRQPTPIQPVFPDETDTPDTVMEPQIAQDQIEIRGEMEVAGAENNTIPTYDEVSGPETTFEPVPEEQPEAPPTIVRTYVPSAPIEIREKSTRIRKPPDRLNLVAEKLPSQTWKEGIRGEWALMTVTRALKLFPDKATTAIESEVKSLLAKGTFSGVHMEQLSPSQRQKILRSNMNVVEKYLPTLNSNGDRQIDKVKARFCVDGRAQLRDDYKADEIESPTATIASIFTVAQIAAVENRFIMVGDVGSAYLNADMPMEKPDKILHMFIDKNIADAIVKQDKSFERYIRHNGGLVVRLDKALYGCIESAKLWYNEIAGTLGRNGFTANPRDICVFNKDVKGNQFTILVYVDDLMMTCVDKKAVLDFEQILLRTYGQFRTTQERVVPYLGCTWDYTESGFVKVTQIGMIQDLISSREKSHAERGMKLIGNPSSPGAPYLFERTLDCKFLNEKHAKTFHTDVATALYLGNRTRPDIVLVLGELCKRVKAPTTEDDKKLDRLICYLRATRDKPLRLGCTLPPTVTVSIDAAFANRDMMKSTSGMCVTLGVGNFISSSKVQKLNSKSSTESEIIAVSDGMNIPLWLAGFIAYQGYGKLPVNLEQDNQSCITLLTKGRSTAETTRFIEVRKFWISDYIRNGAVNVIYVPTEDMTSDYYTKPLQGTIFFKMLKKILGN